MAGYQYTDEEWEALPAAAKVALLDREALKLLHRAIGYMQRSENLRPNRHRSYACGQVAAAANEWLPRCM